MIEIPGPDGPDKAETLRQKLVEVIGDVATITRPIRKGEIRILNLDDSITDQEVTEVIAEAGDYMVNEIKTGQPRKMSNGMFAIWAQCPLAAAIRIPKPGKIKIGWTVAKIELLKARPMQCYRCWEKGHLKNQCKSSQDRSGLCFRCGRTGHIARQCTADLCCALCLSQGKNACHRVGSGLCKAENIRSMPARRAEENMEIDALPDSK